MTKEQYQAQYQHIISQRQKCRNRLNFTRTHGAHNRNFDRAWGKIDLHAARQIDKLDEQMKVTGA